MIIDNPTAADFEMKVDEEHTYPFFEDESGSWIIGLGHQDRTEFARLMNDFDEVTSGGTWPVEEAYAEQHVEWRYGIVYGGDEDTYVLLYHDDHTAITADVPHAVPITVMSR